MPRRSSRKRAAPPSGADETGSSSNGKTTTKSSRPTSTNQRPKKQRGVKELVNELYASDDPKFDFVLDPLDHLDEVVLHWDTDRSAMDLVPAICGLYSDMPEQSKTRLSGGMCLTPNMFDATGPVEPDEFDMNAMLQEKLSTFEFAEFERIQLDHQKEGNVLLYDIARQDGLFDAEKERKLVHQITVGEFMSSLSDKRCGETAKEILDLYKVLGKKTEFRYVTNHTSPYDTGSVCGLGKFFSPLAVNGGVHLGLNARALLLGSYGSASSTHIEQLGFASVNGITFMEDWIKEEDPAAKFWMLPHGDKPHTPTENINARLLQAVVSELIASDHGVDADLNCSALLDDKTIHLDPRFYARHGIKTAHAFQRKNQLMITFSRVFHTVLNMRKNFAAALNFIPYGGKFGAFKIIDGAECQGHDVPGEKEKLFHGKKLKELYAPHILHTQFDKFEAKHRNDYHYNGRTPLLDYDLDADMDAQRRQEVLSNYYRSDTRLWIRDRETGSRQEVVLARPPVPGESSCIIQRAPVRIPTIKHLYTCDKTALFRSEADLVRAEREMRRGKRKLNFKLTEITPEEAFAVDPNPDEWQEPSPYQIDDDGGSSPTVMPILDRYDEVSPNPEPVAVVKSYEHGNRGTPPIQHSPPDSIANHGKGLPPIPRSLDMDARKMQLPGKLSLTRFANSCTPGCVFEICKSFSELVAIQIVNESAYGEIRSRIERATVAFESKSAADHAKSVIRSHRLQAPHHKIRANDYYERNDESGSMSIAIAQPPPAHPQYQQQQLQQYTPHPLTLYHQQQLIQQYTPYPLAPYHQQQYSMQPQYPHPLQWQTQRPNLGAFPQFMPPFNVMNGMFPVEMYSQQAVAPQIHGGVTINNISNNNKYVYNYPKEQ